MSPVRAAIALFLFITLLFIPEGHTSGGGDITITRSDVQVSFYTPRKEPAEGHEKEWYEEVQRWETANKAIAEKALHAIEHAVMPRHRARLAFAKDSFSPLSMVRIDEEGVAESASSDGVWRLTVQLDVATGGNGSDAHFMFTKRPTKAEVRAFSRDVRVAVKKAFGGTVDPLPTYTAYWLAPSTGQPLLLLAAAPLAKLNEEYNLARRGQTTFTRLRGSMALVVATDGKKFIVPTESRLLVTPWSVKTDAAGLVTLNVGGTPITAMPKKATRDEARRLFASPVDPSLSRDAAAEARRAYADDIDFLASLAPQLGR